MQQSNKLRMSAWCLAAVALTLFLLTGLTYATGIAAGIGIGIGIGVVLTLIEHRPTVDPN